MSFKYLRPSVHHLVPTRSRLVDMSSFLPHSLQTKSLTWTKLLHFYFFYIFIELKKYFGLVGRMIKYSRSDVG